mgnify:CR=1 FL=1
MRGYVSEPETTLRRYPASDQSAPAHYARAYAYHKSGYPDQAAAETAALVKTAPDDPYFLELEGQILLESGKPAEAIAPLREATRRSNNQPLIAATFGHALLATEDKANLAEAETVLRTAVARDKENPFAWMQLGTVYERKGDEPRTALATEHALRNGSSTVAQALAVRDGRLVAIGSEQDARSWIGDATHVVERVLRNIGWAGAVKNVMAIAAANLWIMAFLLVDDSTPALFG